MTPAVSIAPRRAPGAAPPEPRYLFVLNPGYCGSTAFAQFLLSSRKAAAVRPDAEGQKMPGPRELMLEGRWNEARPMPWDRIKALWLDAWHAGARRAREACVLIEKSPPNLMRAAAIEQAFPGARFIVWMRDPYAWCASVSARNAARRGRTPHAEWAQGWLMRARRQRWNAENLRHTLRLSYEEFVADVEGARRRIAEFCEDLDDLRIDTKVRVKDYARSGIVDHNARQIASLGPGEVEEISAELAKEESLVRYFNYSIRQTEKVN